jgi:uncharacterized membrane protein
MAAERKYWLDDPRNVNKVFYGVCILCALVAALDIGGVFYEKHPHHPAERIWNFYGFYGFVACWLLVLAAKQLRKLVMRKEDFYD